MRELRVELELHEIQVDQEQDWEELDLESELESQLVPPAVRMGLLLSRYCQCHVSSSLKSAFVSDSVFCRHSPLNVL